MMKIASDGNADTSFASTVDEHTRFHDESESRRFATQCTLKNATETH